VKKRIIFLILISFFLIISAFPITNSNEIPTCELVITSYTKKINPGENFTITFYLVGSGIVKTGYIIANSGRNMIFEELKFIDRYNNQVIWSKEYLNKSYVIGVYPVIPLRISVENEENITWEESGISGASINLLVQTNNSISPGNHDITITYVFQDNESNWNRASNIFTIYVNTPEEQNAWFYYLFGSIIIPIGLTTISVLGAFWVTYHFYLKDKRIVINILPKENTTSNHKQEEKKEGKKQSQNKQKAKNQ
jgi:hypothetical protein